MNDAESPTTKAFPTFLQACAILVISQGAAGVVCAYCGNAQSGRSGIAAAVVAATITLVAGIVGLGLSHWMQGDQAVQGVLGGMLIRVGIPLSTGLGLQRYGGPLADAGVFGMIVACYLVMLIVETMLLVRLIRPTQASSARGT